MHVKNMSVTKFKLSLSTYQQFINFEWFIWYTIKFDRPIKHKCLKFNQLNLLFDFLYIFIRLILC